MDEGPVWLEAMEMKTLVLDGKAIGSISDFYEEINRVFMASEDWRLGESLDALDDLLHGGYGAIAGNEPVTLVWRDMAASREALGIDATHALLVERLRLRTTFNGRPVVDQIAELEQGRGVTYFDIVLEIIAAHPNIQLVSS